MIVSDLIFDSSLGQRGIIIDTKEWWNPGCEEPEYEHTILYEDGELDTAYENELEVINESW
jgi:hypothetical protein